MVDETQAETPAPAPTDATAAETAAVAPASGDAPTSASAPAPASAAQTEPQTVAPDPSQFKKDELVTAADVQGVEVDKDDTKADIAEKLATPAAPPVLVNNYTRRSDDDAILGSWVDVVAGEHEGRRGFYADDASHDPQTGYPDEVLVRTRDAENLLISVKYSDIRPSAYTGGR